ncbi:Holliday junction-specific endonuclease [Spiroplasma sp. TIUS-1]|uniref:Holliday junction resolvase RecU n=1 Tax=Spiroplasma sp. TIUS-1 TaxID=216963 RepID=UPI0013995EE3|nr:Holliday junction resolvase RecU [Spiroplasma sp. TIUS-1]QHX36009.1 Holliday junction-specific endonuclease [Spiroplasma sp. TIUS-1]
MVLKNKGMFLETILNHNIERLNIEGSCQIFKMPINSKIISKESDKFLVKLNKNYFCDYIGIYRGRYIEFEAKETELSYFSLSNIKKHQLAKIKMISELGGIGFFIVYFHLTNDYFCLTINELQNFNVNKIPYDWFSNNGTKIEFDGLNVYLELILDLF